MRKTIITDSSSKRGAGGRNAEPTSTLPTEPAVPVGGSVLTPQDLAFP